MEADPLIRKSIEKDYRKFSIGKLVSKTGENRRRLKIKIDNKLELNKINNNK